MHSSAWEIAEANVDTRWAAGKALLRKPCVHSSSCLLHFFQMRKLRRRRPRSRSPRGTRPGCSPGKRPCSLLGPGPQRSTGCGSGQGHVSSGPQHSVWPGCGAPSPLRGHAGSTAVRSPHSRAPKRSSSSGASVSSPLTWAQRELVPRRKRSACKALSPGPGGVRGQGGARTVLVQLSHQGTRENWGLEGSGRGCLSPPVPGQAPGRVRKRSPLTALA